MSELRAFAPLQADHHLVVEHKTCPACKNAFAAGDVITLVPLGPGDDAESRERARQGRVYNAVAAPVHYACATGIEP